MRDKRGMRDKGLPENTRTKRTMRTKVLPVRFRDVCVSRLGACLRWGPGAVSGIVRCKLELNMRTKPPGRLAMPWVSRWRE